MSLDEIERHYKLFTSAIFEQNKAAGIGGLLLSQSYYDTKIWEKMLQ
jgi:hypothetical protein